MKFFNLLEFLNNAKSLQMLDYARCCSSLVNYLETMPIEEQFFKNFDVGVFFLKETDYEKYTIIDGASRLLSLSLLLHSICECYKRTTQKNEKAIETIRRKYLLGGKNLKLRLSEPENTIYQKIINGERLSGHEKSTPMFLLMHKYWTIIKENKLQAASIFNTLNKYTVTIANVENVSMRNLYYSLHDKNSLNQLLLIEDYISEKKCIDSWQNVKNSLLNNDEDLILFLNDYFVTKFNIKTYKSEDLYMNFYNYFETMSEYTKPIAVMAQLSKAAKLYSEIINIQMEDGEVKRSIINIKKHQGDDTLAYILNAYTDYREGNLTEDTFVEILKTIDEFLVSRQSSGNSTDFNELINYLNAFITYK